VGPAGRLVRWARRSKAVAASLFGVVVLALVAALFAFQSHRARRELLQGQRQRAIDEALVAARNGDFDQAQHAIGEAESLGVAPGWLRLLQGQLAFHRSESHEAVAHLGEAARLLPESLTAQSMLAVAYWQNGQWDKFEAVFRGLGKLRPVTPEDYLFSGYAEASLDPEIGLPKIDEAIRQRRSLIARAMRAEVLSWLAQDKTDAAAVERALRDAQTVKEDLPGKPMGPLAGLYARLVAATIYEETGRPEKRRTALEEAARDARELEAFPDLGWAVLLRYRYLEYTGQDQAAFEQMERAAGRVQGPWPATYHAMGLYRRGEFDKALAELQRLGEGGAFQDTMRMYILAERPGGAPRAVELHDQCAGRYEGSVPLFHHAVLYLLGRKREAAAAFDAMRRNPETLPRLRTASYRRLLDFNCGLLAADKLLDAAADSRYDRCNAEFFVAMSLLADGDRAAARRHFQRCVDLRVFDFDATDWSRTFLARMDRDPQWPRWIRQGP
jgi:tetratricopeptide (TPR) repeat protein